MVHTLPCRKAARTVKNEPSLLTRNREKIREKRTRERDTPLSLSFFLVWRERERERKEGQNKKGRPTIRHTLGSIDRAARQCFKIKNLKQLNDTVDRKIIGRGRPVSARSFVQAVTGESVELITGRGLGCPLGTKTGVGAY